MFERFTDRARRVVVEAQEAGRALSHNYIGTEHLLLGLFDTEGGVSSRALHDLGVTKDRMIGFIITEVGQGSAPPSGYVPFTPRAKKVLELALREALDQGVNYVGTEHLLLGVVRLNDGRAVSVLTKEFGLTAEQIKLAVLKYLPNSSKTGVTSSEIRYSRLDRSSVCQFLEWLSKQPVPDQLPAAGLGRILQAGEGVPTGLAEVAVTPYVTAHIEAFCRWFRTLEDIERAQHPARMLYLQLHEDFPEL